MCQKCIEAVKETWPDLPESDYTSLLWGATAYPCSGPEETRKMLIEIGKKSNYNLELALAIVDTEMENEMVTPTKPKIGEEKKLREIVYTKQFLCELDDMGISFDCLGLQNDIEE